MLRTQAVLPEHAAVANAVGAVTGRVIAIAEVEVRPVTGDNYGDALVVAQDTRQVFSSRTKVSPLPAGSRRLVREKALAQGASDRLEIREERVRNEAPMGYGTIWLGRYPALYRIRKYPVKKYPIKKQAKRQPHQDSRMPAVFFTIFFLLSSLAFFYYLFSVCRPVFPSRFFCVTGLRYGRRFS